ncbi:NAD(FAD)-dependent dehydrogenase [Sphingomonas oleivorans]|uniref:NAD(FAD)-dependent dehydrogenase n=1 Tax=Sphingomonas oleivorans TaxID=1735121 RepID=A0A2T5FZK5_9SPHN|nr:(2Fe-2S)-binding protein [Sphingomonas oleivorans]PTQ12131.1 NAD(FAD)-dependent dehydrogenase [Sphingomonas oleivorans]
MSAGRFRRLGETDRPSVEIEVDGEQVVALEGDSLLVAVLASGRTLRRSEFGDGDRSGFCLMGACQDCWMWTAEGGRVRACTTPVRAGLRLITQAMSEDLWPIPA